MSDFELNKAIAEALGLHVLNRIGDESGVYTLENDMLDYCNNWNDLMPLVMKYAHEFDWVLPITPDDGAFMFLYKQENPQRALAECLLKVLTKSVLK